MRFSSWLLNHLKFFILGLLFLCATLIYADNGSNDNCNDEEIILELDNKSTSAFHIEAGSVNKSNDKYDYYRFTVGMSGNINLSLDMKSIIIGSKHNSIIVGSNCNEDNYYNNSSDSNIKTAPSFFVKAGTTVHIRVEGRYKPLLGTRTLEYELKISIDNSNVSENQRSFALRNPLDTRNIRGDYQLIGNTVLCAQKLIGGECFDYTSGQIFGSLPDWQSNVSLLMKYIDVDGDASTFNSSQAKLNIPTDAKVTWAAIYAKGHIFYKFKEGALDKLNEPMKISVPNVAPINSIPQQIDLYQSGVLFGYTYSTYSDIPELVGKKGSDINGMVTVANVKANKDGVNTSSLGRFGAWALVVIYEDENSSLKNISVFDGYRAIKDQAGFNDSTINVDGFITPTNGEIVSRVSIFVGEGDRAIGKDRLFLNNTAIGHQYGNEKDNAFYSHITDDIERYPSYTNNLGIDIQTFDVGTGGLSLVKNGNDRAEIKFSTARDDYFPSLAIFSTNLYEPRVCYRQELFDKNGNIIEDIKVGDIITVQTWISNMKKDSTDISLEPADKVEITVELDDKNLEYISGSIKMQNIYEDSFTSNTDKQGDDLAEFFSSTNTTKWRVGLNASSTDGGKLTPNYTTSDDNKAFVTFQTKVLQEGDVNINNIYKVSYENPQIGIRFGDESPINIGICADINTSLGVAGIVGKFNIVNVNGGNGDYNNPKSSNTWLTTQVVNRQFYAKIISLNDVRTALESYTGEIKISLIENPYSTEDSDDIKQEKCDASVAISNIKSFNFSGTNQTESFNYSKAVRNALFKISYEKNGEIKHACSVDSFALRPDRFVLSVPTGESIELLTSAKIYKFPLTASQYGNNTPANNYNISSSNNNFLTLEKTLYMPNGDQNENLKGSLEFASTPLTIIDGQADIGIAFTDVARVKIRVVDRTWATVDIENDDTAPECSLAGAWICGEIEATFIPSHFALSDVTLHNNKDSSFTYFSSDLNMSAPFSVTLTAQNKLNATTQNFDKEYWENKVGVHIAVPTITKDIEMQAKTNEITIGQNLDFEKGVKKISISNDESTSQLSFNFNRVVDIPINPFVVKGSDVNLTAISNYTALGKTVKVEGNKVAENNATFIYGRTHASRQRYDGDSGRAFIYFEAYCFGGSCDKTLLPDGLNSKNTNDLRWFINSHHDVANDGSVVDRVIEKLPNSVVTEDIDARDSVRNKIEVKLNYDSSFGYPYKTTMENNASSWLIYNQRDANATTNEFSVEYSKSGGWSGKKETDTVTKSLEVPKTNRRSMW